MPIPKVGGAFEQPTFDALGASNLSSFPLMMRLNYYQIHLIFSNSSLSHVVHTSLLEISDDIHAVLSVIPYNDPTIHNSSGFFMIHSNCLPQVTSWIQYHLIPRGSNHPKQWLKDQTRCSRCIAIQCGSKYLKSIDLSST